MAKKRWIALLTALTLGLTGCGASAATVESVGAEPVLPDGQYSAPLLSSEQTLRQNIFALRSGYDLLSGGEDVCYSPVSAYFALALAATGADGQTQKELLAVLDAPDSETLSSDMKALFEAFYQIGEIWTVYPTNSLWLNRGVDVYDTFTDNAAQNFYAHTFTLDFGDAKAGDTITNWISEQTKGLLAPQIDVDSSDAAVLLNTLYFKTNWLEPFSEERTAPAPFISSDGTEIECDFMHATRTGAFFELNGHMKIASLPLYGGYDMVFLLPDEELGIDGLLAQYSADRLLSMKALPADSAINYNSEVYSGLPVWVCQVEWSIPKFHASEEIDLIGMLGRLGIHDAFSAEDADFSKLCDTSTLPGGSLYISRVQHGADVSVDEKGVEAAAYTEIGLRAGGAAPPEQIEEMKLDRPFLYGIRSDNGVFLFIGRCDHPSAS